MSKRRSAALVCALGLAAAFTLLAAGPAGAHVTITPSEGEAGSYTVLTASVPHGCEGSPSTKVAIQVPEEILSVTPTRHPMWEVEKVMTKLDEPVTDSHGNEVTERVGQVVYTAKEPLPEGYRDAFELSLQLPDAPGETLAFPTVQTCEQGETAWTQVPSGDQSADDLDAPAPTVEVQQADAESAQLADGTDAEPTAAGTDTSGPSAWEVAGLVAGLLGLAAGAVALVLVRRRS